MQCPKTVLDVLAKLVDLQVVDHFEDLLQVAHAARLQLTSVQGSQNEDGPVFAQVGEVHLRG